MRIYTLDCELITRVSIQETFEVFKNPYNLARITPPGLNLRIITQNLEMKKGTEIEYGLRWFGLPLAWKTVITEYEPPFLFVDEAVRSPYKLWRHRHTFRPTEQGTVVADRVEYALPLGIAGQLVHKLAVRRQLVHIFRFRQNAIVELLGGKAIEVKEPAIT